MGKKTKKILGSDGVKMEHYSAARCKAGASVKVSDLVWEESGALKETM